MTQMEPVTPVEITPQVGDHFTDYVQYYTYDATTNPIYDYELSDDVFTWGEQGFSFYSSYPVDGQYAVGIIAYDFDNNFVANFEFINLSALDNVMSLKPSSPADAVKLFLWLEMPVEAKFLVQTTLQHRHHHRLSIHH